MGDLIYRPRAGTYITDACREACALSHDSGLDLFLDFNGTEVRVAPGDGADYIAELWLSKRNQGTQQ